MDEYGKQVEYNLSRIDHSIVQSVVGDELKIMTTDKGPDKPLTILKNKQDWYEHFFDKDPPVENQS